MRNGESCCRVAAGVLAGALVLAVPPVRAQETEAAAPSGSRRSQAARMSATSRSKPARWSIRE